MQLHKMEQSEWPPASFTDAMEPDPVYIDQMASSLRSSAKMAARDYHQVKHASWCANHAKVFHHTPEFNYNCSNEEGAVPERSDGAALLSRPPSLIGGANGQADQSGPEVSIDWLTMTGPRSMMNRTLIMLERFFGSATGGKGKFFMDSGYRIAAGGIYFDNEKENNSDYCVVDLPGSLLAEMNNLDLVQHLTTELTGMGFKATRVDIAVDTFDTPKLISDAQQSCEDAELTGAKTYQVVESHSKGVCTGKTLYIGKRGKNGSGRFLRIYDKGLETATKTEGEWTRWESVLYADCARQFVESFVDAGDAVRVCLSHAYGVCDFKQNPGLKLARRKRCEWFSQYVGSVQTRRVRISRVASTMYTKIRWIKQCVAPMLKTIQRCTGCTLDRVMGEITGPVGSRLRYLDDVMVRTVVASLGVDHTMIYESYKSGGEHG